MAFHSSIQYGDKSFKNLCVALLSVVSYIELIKSTSNVARNITVSYVHFYLSLLNYIWEMRYSWQDIPGTVASKSILSHYTSLISTRHLLSFKRKVKSISYLFIFRLSTSFLPSIECETDNSVTTSILFLTTAPSAKVLLTLLTDLCYFFISHCNQSIIYSVVYIMQ